jgi:hypothetical protein
MYTKAAVWATSATPLPMWDVEGSGMVPYQIWYLISVTALATYASGFCLSPYQSFHIRMRRFDTVPNEIGFPL